MTVYHVELGSNGRYVSYNAYRDGQYDDIFSVTTETLVNQYRFCYTVYIVLYCYIVALRWSVNLGETERTISNLNNLAESFARSNNFCFQVPN